MLCSLRFLGNDSDHQLELSNAPFVIDLLASSKCGAPWGNGIEIRQLVVDLPSSPWMSSFGTSSGQKGSALYTAWSRW
jgi:hypothetical protein